MKQAVVKKGKVIAQEVPAPIVSPGYVLIEVKNSCISAGTETTGVRTSGTPLYKRALKEPENVRKVISFIKEKGILKAIQTINDKVEAGAATGYSISGKVIDIGEGVENFSIGDRVAAAGAGIANHAEFVAVPKNLVIPIPEGLSYEYSSTVTLGGIAIQGIRRADLKLGEFAVVFGVGILGLLTVQLLKASGIRVAAIDIDERRLELSKQLGAEITINSNRKNIIDEVLNWTNGYGADSVLFTAATSDSKPLSDSFKISKKKGNVVLVGVSGMELNREDLYSKELDFLISTSYGPGRYDKYYEQNGIDYPYSYVRWTENRNMKEYLRLLSTGAINVEPLINGRYSIDQIEQAFKSLNSLEDKPLLVIISYKDSQYKTTIHIKDIKTKKYSKILNVGLIGLGGFAQTTHIPNIINLKSKYFLHTIVDRTGLKARNIAEQFNIPNIETDYKETLNNKEIDVILICTRHSNHAEITLEALNAGKHVFVEKPLAINIKELNAIKEFFKDNDEHPFLMVGYNRRFSPSITKIQEIITTRKSPVILNYRMNAGYLPKEHWAHEDGGRIVGEACHIIDLFSYMTGSKVYSVNIENLSFTESKYLNEDNKILTLKYQDGSIGTIHYFSTGNKKLGKEYLEIHWDGKSIILDNYESLTYFDNVVNISKIQGKGHKEELIEFHNSIINRSAPPISYESIFETSEISLSAK